jgi:hypothetical protein
MRNASMLELPHPLIELYLASEAENCAVTQEIPCILWKPKVHYRTHRSPPLVHILNRIKPINTIPYHLSKIHFNIVHGGAMAEAVSCWLPTAAARVQSRVWSSGIYGGQSGAWAGFLRVLRFPLPFIPPNSPSSQSPGAGTIGQ